MPIGWNHFYGISGAAIYVVRDINVKVVKLLRDLLTKIARNSSNASLFLK
jgi:hypothetical protein